MAQTAIALPPTLVPLPLIEGSQDDGTLNKSLNAYVWQPPQRGWLALFLIGLAGTGVVAVIKGERGSGVLGINGAAAHLVHPGDLVILISYGQMDDAEAATYEPRVVFVDADNRIVGTGADPAESLPGMDTLRGDSVYGGTLHGGPAAR